MDYALQQFANAVPLSALYALLAFGYALSFALTKRADLTYGALFAFSGHAFLLGAHAGWNILFLTFTASLSVGAVLTLLVVLPLGVIIGHRIAAPLSAVSPNAFTVASLGLLLVLMESARLASGTQELWLPPFLNQSIAVLPKLRSPVALTVLQLANTATVLVLLVSAAAFVALSQWGRNWRAVSQDRLAAEMCGVNSQAMCTQTYALSALLAGLGGVLATMHYGTMGFGAGLIFGLKIVLISAAGGHLHPWRSAVGAAVFAFGETFWSAFAPLAWRDAALISLLALLLVMTRQQKPMV
ncbi:branched-chain amino acid ABC transporter permease [Rhizobium sp. FKY42]|uniref:branched-chain amino acid ABC transporter permease n=1 Tax=Rhizobium sp. FKY42 TaxID=2562310 RepID=UPI0010C146A9|nr:branched-chain amino acid ABC transporter permease [Rhizobium sp. FKY42]